MSESWTCAVGGAIGASAVLIVAAGCWWVIRWLQTRALRRILREVEDVLPPLTWED